MNVLVTGANGFVGAHLTPALLKAGHGVTALVRDAAAYDPPANVDVVEGDMLEPTSIGTRLDEIDAAYYLIHSLRTGAGFAERDQQLATNFVALAERVGIRRVIYLGGLGETGAELSAHLQSRQDVETTLANGRYALTTLRAAVIIGRGSASFRMIQQLASRLPVMVTPKWVRTPSQPIAIRDVVAYLVAVLDIEETAGETYEIGGPEVLTYEEIIRRTAAKMGKSPLILPIPVLSPRLSVYWVDLVTDVPRSVAHPLIYGLKNPVVVRDDRIRELLPIELTGFDDAVREALDG